MDRRAPAPSEAGSAILEHLRAQSVTARQLVAITYTYERRIGCGRREHGDIESVHLRGQLVYFTANEGIHGGMFARRGLWAGVILDVAANNMIDGTIGTVCFVSERKDSHALSVPSGDQKLHVHYAYRMHGIGTKMYELAARSVARFGLQLVPSVFQTDDGRAMWRRLSERGLGCPEKYDARL